MLKHAKTILGLLLLFALSFSASAQTPATKLTTLILSGTFTNTALANGDNFLIYADANGALHVTPWTTNMFYWITNSSGSGLGFSNTVSPITIFGTLTAANLNGTVGSLTNGGWRNPSFTNAVNYGNAFSSVGSGINSLQVGANANATATSSSAVGPNANATGFHSLAVGNSAIAAGYQGTAVGQAASAADTNTSAFGAQASVQVGATNSTAVGFGAVASTPNIVMLGAAAGGGIPAISAVVNNYLQVLGGLTVASGVTNLQLNGTNTLVAGADIAFTRYALTTLANGNNAAIPVNTNVFVEVSGPSGAFTINGISGSPNRDGKFLIIKNATGQNMTLANQSGTDPTPGNRILTGYNADHTYTNNPGLVTLIYDGNASRWLVVSQNGNQ